jgi:small neutral amino acid transporter SnatA (MarC family)
MAHTFVSALVLLVLILDPLGNIATFASALKSRPAGTRWPVILREHGIAYVVLLGFMFGGEGFLTVIGLSSASVQLAGGVILFLISLRMIFPQPAAPEIEIPEPFIVPLAVPMIAGPSAMATVMLLVSQQPGRILEWVGALTVAIGVSTVILLSAARLQHLLGERFVIAMERLMGLMLVAVAIEMMVRGARIAIATT